MLISSKIVQRKGHVLSGWGIQSLFQTFFTVITDKGSDLKVSFGYLREVSRHQQCFLHLILILLWTFLCVLTFISEDMSLSTVHVEPNRVSVPAGETAARFLSGLEMKKQCETIWGRQRGLFLNPNSMCVGCLCVVVWQNSGSFSLATSGFWNRPLILFHRHSAKRRVSQREMCTWPEMQEYEPAGGDVTSLGQSGKQSWDTSPSIRACLLLLNCKNGLFH